MSESLAVPGIPGFYLAGIFSVIALMAAAMALLMVITTFRHFRDDPVDILSVVPVVLTMAALVSTAVAGGSAAYLFVGAR